MILLVFSNTVYTEQASHQINDSVLFPLPSLLPKIIRMNDLELSLACEDCAKSLKGLRLGLTGWLTLLKVATRRS